MTGPQSQDRLPSVSAQPSATSKTLTRVDSQTASTRTKIILAAERLFAERGVAAVPMRDIVAAAGQRNASAIQYHFGPRPDLVTAVYEFRMRQVNERRLELLARMQATGRTADVRSLVEALIEPLVSVASEPGCHYARFVSQLSADPAYEIPRDWQVASSLHAVRDGLRLILAQLPDDIYDERWRMITHLVVRMIADRENDLGLADDDQDVPQGWVARLVEACVALLSAPVSQMQDGTPPDAP